MLLAATYIDVFTCALHHTVGSAFGHQKRVHLQIVLVLLVILWHLLYTPSIVLLDMVEVLLSFIAQLTLSKKFYTLLQVWQCECTNSVWSSTRLSSVASPTQLDLSGSSGASPPNVRCDWNNREDQEARELPQSRGSLEGRKGVSCGQVCWSLCIFSQLLINAGNQLVETRYQGRCYLFLFLVLHAVSPPLFIYNDYIES